jgi:rare lipoprotein A
MGCAGGSGSALTRRSSTGPDSSQEDGGGESDSPRTVETEDASSSPYAAEFGNAAVLETLIGRASYYSDRLAGRSTASGEPYRTTEFTAASRELRFGTILRVTREDTGAVTYVRVNDRGPFGDHRRIIDLSRAAAEDLDMIRAGVVAVRVEIVHRPAR